MRRAWYTPKRSGGGYGSEADPVAAGTNDEASAYDDSPKKKLSQKNTQKTIHKKKQKKTPDMHRALYSCWLVLIAGFQYNVANGFDAVFGGKNNAAFFQTYFPGYLVGDIVDGVGDGNIGDEVEPVGCFE